MTNDLFAKLIRLENKIMVQEDRIKELERALDECREELQEAIDKMGVLADIGEQPNDSEL